MATGPSLRRDDVNALRGLGPVVAVNCGVFFAPHADYLFAADNVWWRHYGPMIEWYKGHRASRTAREARIEKWQGRGWGQTGGNSGHMAIQYAVDQGATHVALLGFDQQKTSGKAHCHADHPKMDRKGAPTNMANAGGVTTWPRRMAQTAIELKRRGIEVINLSRETALTCFPRMTVEDFLNQHGTRP